MAYPAIVAGWMCSRFMTTHADIAVERSCIPLCNKVNKIRISSRMPSLSWRANIEYFLGLSAAVTGSAGENLCCMH